MTVEDARDRSRAVAAGGRPPQKAPGLHSVGAVPGLSLQVTDSGARLWILRVKVGADVATWGSGPIRQVTLAQAREKARQARERIDQGVDRVLERQRARPRLLAQQAGPSPSSMLPGFHELKSKEWSNPKHAAQWVSTLEIYAYPIIGDMHVADIERSHVLKCLEPIWTSKTGQPHACVVGSRTCWTGRGSRATATARTCAMARPSGQAAGGADEIAKVEHEVRSLSVMRRIFAGLVSGMASQRRRWRSQC